MLFLEKCNDTQSLKTDDIFSGGERGRGLFFFRSPFTIFVIIQTDDF